MSHSVSPTYSLKFYCIVQSVTITQLNQLQYSGTTGTGTQVMPSIQQFTAEKIETLSHLFKKKNLLLSYQFRQLKMSRTSPFCKQLQTRASVYCAKKASKFISAKDVGELDPCQVIQPLRAHNKRWAYIFPIQLRFCFCCSTKRKKENSSSSFVGSA